MGEYRNSDAHGLKRRPPRPARSDCQILVSHRASNLNRRVAEAHPLRASHATRHAASPGTTRVNEEHGRARLTREPSAARRRGTRRQRHLVAREQLDAEPDTRRGPPAVPCEPPVGAADGAGSGARERLIESEPRVGPEHAPEGERHGGQADAGTCPSRRCQAVGLPDDEAATMSVRAPRPPWVCCRAFPP